MMAGNVCLVLTSTIQVDHPEFLRPNGRLDTRQRLDDYRTALESWITRQDSLCDIVFVDNSGYPLDALQAVVDRHAAAGKRVELISFRTEGYSPSRGRSFGELDILRTALNRSTLLAGSDVFAKVTGRVFIPNVDAIIRAVASDCDIVGRLTSNLTWLDTVFVLFRKELFAQRLLPYALKHVDSQKRQFIEHALASECLRSIADGARWYPFPAEPRICGLRGLDSQPYPSGLLRARAIDLFAWGHHRATDTSSSIAKPHPLSRWAVTHHGAGSSPDNKTGNNTESSAAHKSVARDEPELP
jgi:hypothetical protein